MLALSTAAVESTQSGMDAVSRILLTLFYLSAKTTIAFHLSSPSTCFDRYASFPAWRFLVPSANSYKAKSLLNFHATTDEKLRENTEVHESEERLGTKGNEDDNFVGRNSSSSLSVFTALLDECTDQFENLRGTAELVDKLENLVTKHPG